MVQFKYRISPFSYLKYFLYKFRWAITLLPIPVCMGMTPLEGEDPLLSCVIYYVLILLPLFASTAAIGLVTSLLLIVGQGQAGKEALVRVDDAGITEKWGEREVFIPWRDVKRVTLRKKFVQVKGRRVHWHLFQSAAGYEHFQELTALIRRQTAS